MIRISKNAELTPLMVKTLIEQHKGHEVPRFLDLDRYYKGQHDIKRRIMVDSTKPNNRIVNPFANYITDLFVGYFMGEPVKYSAEDEKALEALTLTLNYNDEQDENSEIAKDASIYGVGYEMLYVDEEGSVRFKRIKPEEVIIVYDDTVEGEMLYAIRYFLTKGIDGQDSHMVEVYSRTNVRTYTSDALLSALTLVEERPHSFGLVPFSIFKNNDDLIGDFELVISLIDAYDKLESDSLNDFEYFTDAYLGLYGMDADTEDIKAMKENRILLMPEDGKAEWIIKSVNDAQIENLKTRLAEDIHKFSKCPAMTDENFASNASGVAMAYKIMGMENVAAIKERKFKKGLQRRIELLSNIMPLTSNISFDWRSIELNFNRNLPANINEMADMINKLRGIVSNETLLTQVTFVEDVQEELKKLEQEKEKAFSAFDPFEVGEDDEDATVLATDSSADSRDAV